MASCDDYKTLYDSCDTIEEVILSLQSSSKKLFQWLSGNQMKDNAVKCLLLRSTNESVDFQLGGSVIKRRDCEKILGVTLNTNIIT